jgi:hypothetical protein
MMVLESTGVLVSKIDSQYIADGGLTGAGITGTCA